MIDYHEIREFKRTEYRKGEEVTVIVWVPMDGRPPLVHTVVISGARKEWSEDDPNRPSYGSVSDFSTDLTNAFDVGFAYAETLI